MLKRFWQGLPWDGLGWGNGDDAFFREIRSRAAQDWRQAYSLPMRALLWMADRAIWPFAALSRTLSFARARGVGWAGAARLFGDCLLTGGASVETYVWRALYGGRHPLPARSASLVLTRLGDPTGHALLADKLAAAERLTAAGGVFPALRGLYPRGGAIDLDRLAGMTSSNGLFLKPRHGYGGRGAFAITSCDGIWRVGRHRIETAQLLARLSVLCREDDMLAQELLVTVETLTDLATEGRAPVLRIGTARLPGEPPFLHSAMLTIAVPGRNPRHFLDGGIHAPINLSLGRLAAGVSFAEPRTRLERLSWNQSRLEGRPLPAFGEASAMVLKCMAALPPLPLVHWDLIITDKGPVLLEGNTGGNWILTCLPGLYGLDWRPLAPIMAGWKSSARIPAHFPCG